MLWKKTSTGGWDKESEFDPASSSNITEDKSSALIMLVLDCTNSLGSDFGNMQQSAKNFIYTLANTNGGGDNPGGGENPNNLPTTLNETFENGAEGWFTYDADGDGNAWYFSSNAGVNGSVCAGSDSYNDDTETPINADNYLISPEIYIPNDGRTLTYQVTNWQTDFPDHYSVLIIPTTNGTYNISQAQTIRSSETVSTETPDFTSRSISLSAYRNQSIRIAFRHTDYDQLGILIDNVKVQ